MHVFSTAAKQLLLGKRENIHILKRFLNINKWVKRKMAGENVPPHRSDPIIKTLDCPEFKSIFTPELEELASIFKRYNYEIRVAGGAVRDILMGIHPKDLDFATTATPTQMKDMFDQEKIRLINSNGMKHGTITSRINDKENFEITTLRIDVVTDGRHAEVEFTTDWLLDASRRDLTINSMFLDLDGKVYDYFYGYDDLMKRKIQFVGEPSQRIQEDFLRIFRYFRFYGRIADVPDNHDDKTIEAIKSNVEGLDRISGERIWTEWNKILQGNFSIEMTKLIIECGCGKYMGLPKNVNLEELYKVFDRAQKNNIKLRPISMVAALIDTRDEFMQLHNRLKFPNIDRDTALFIIDYRNDDLLSERPLKPYQRHVLKTIMKVSDVRSCICEFFKYKGALKQLEEFEKWEGQFPIKTNLLVPYVSDNPKLVGIIISKLKDIWVDSDFQISDDELMSHVPALVQEARDEWEKLKILREERFKRAKLERKERKKSLIN